MLISRVSLFRNQTLSLNALYLHTGADRSIGRQLLEICNWNLEMAIGMHMDEEEGVGADRALASGSGFQSRLGPVEGLEPGAAATAAEEGEDL